VQVQLVGEDTNDAVGAFSEAAGTEKIDQTALFEESMKVTADDDAVETVVAVN
jgi:hypothetical protein